MGSRKTSKSKVPLLERCQTIVPYDALIVRIGASLYLFISNKIEPRIREFHCDIRNWETLGHAVSIRKAPKKNLKILIESINGGYKVLRSAFSVS